VIFLTLRSPFLKRSAIRKIIKKSERQTGWKALKSRPVMNTEAQEEMLGTKQLARLTQKSVGIVLTNRGIKDKPQRARLQLALQLLWRDNGPREQYQTAKEILLTEFKTHRAASEFTEEVLRIYNLNMMRLVEQKQTEAEIRARIKKRKGGIL
jgi:hypothetical protein